MVKEEDCGPILSVSFARKMETLGWNRKRVVHYRVQINGKPGHDIIELPWYNFSQRPAAGDKLIFLMEASSGGAEVVYRVVKADRSQNHVDPVRLQIQNKAARVR